MFRKNKLEEIDAKKINEVATLSARVLKIIYLLLAFLVIYIVIRLFKETQILSFIGTIIQILVPLIIGLIIAWLFEPVVAFFERKHIKRVFGTIITYIILFAIVALVMSALIPLMANQIMQFAKAAPDIFNSIKNYKPNPEVYKIEDKLPWISAKEIAKYGGDISKFVPESVVKYFNNIQER